MSDFRLTVHADGEEVIEALVGLGFVVLPSFEPGFLVDVACEVEDRLRDHQERDGSYSCDAHVIVAHVLDALLVVGHGEDRASEARR
jgi:rhamnose utilization protein RhaD (predicted bifunctional aldolase and dehydrogenase)